MPTQISPTYDVCTHSRYRMHTEHTNTHTHCNTHTHTNTPCADWCKESCPLSLETVGLTNRSGSTISRFGYSALNTVPRCESLTSHEGRLQSVRRPHFRHWHLHPSFQLTLPPPFDRNSVVLLHIAVLTPDCTVLDRKCPFTVCVLFIGCKGKTWSPRSFLGDITDVRQVGRDGRGLDWHQIHNIGQWVWRESDSDHHSTLNGLEHSTYTQPY